MSTPIRPRGEDVAEALRTWSRDPISSISPVRETLGKDYFTVTSATAAVVVSLEKLGQEPGKSPSLASIAWPLIALGVAALFAILLAMPRHWRLRSTSDLLRRWSAGAAALT